MKTCRWKIFMATLWATCLVASALAADPVRSDSIDNSGTRKLGGAPATQWFGSVGISYIDAEDSAKTWLTPFSLEARLTRDTAIRLEGDGYGQTNFDGDKTSGLNNLTLIASHVIYRDESSRLRMAIGATAPGSSGVGSRGSRQRVSASFTQQLDSRWAIQLSARLNRRNEDLRPGESRIEKFGRIKMTYDLDEASRSTYVQRAVIAQIERDYRTGAGGSTQATVSYEFPLSNEMGVGIGIARGLTSGLRDNTLAFDLLYAF